MEPTVVHVYSSVRVAVVVFPGHINMVLQLLIKLHSLKSMLAIMQVRTTPPYSFGIPVSISSLSL